MRCLCCQQETPAAVLQKFDTLLLCPQCFKLAESQWKPIEAAQDRARVMARQWLVTRIASGVVLMEGSGAEGMPVPT